MKYIIDVPEEIAEISEEFLSKAGLLCEPYTDIDIKEKAEEFSRGYDEGWDAGSKFHEAEKESIEDEVWELAIACLKMDGSDFFNAFGSSMVDCLTEFSYQEAKAKFEAWLKQKDKIHVGDEVNPINDTWRGVVVNVDNGDLTIMGSRGISSNGYESKYFSKTGRHFDEVAELLKKMREEEQ